MKLRKRDVWRLLGAVAGLVLLAGLAAPFINADRFGRRIQASLEQALHRRVEIGRVRLDLFNGPGFSVSDVTICDDPRIGIEPLAYVASLETRISLKSLWTGHLDFSSLRLNEPSVNLVKPPSGTWNFEALLSRTFGAAPEAGAAFPAIRVRGGRVNFRFGDVKSVFYITNADIDIEPPRAGEPFWELRFSGEPARTDRAAYGFGRFSGRGRWRPDRRRGDQLDLTLDLERSYLEEVVALLRGHDAGVHGHITSRARLTGPVSDLQVTGRVELEDIHRWDLMPPHRGNWSFEYRGRLDTVSQRLELETVSPAGEPLPLSLRFRASGYLSQPRWGVLVTLRGVPARSFPQLGRHLGLALPQGLEVEGAVSGVVGYSMDSGFQGTLVAQNITVRAPDSLPLRCARARVLVDRNRLQFDPVMVEFPRNERAIFDGTYAWDTQTLDLRLATEFMSITGPGPAGLRPLGAAAVPLLEQCQGGAWKGELRYRRESEQHPEWSGRLALEDTQISLPGMAAPLEIVSARAVLKDGGAVLDRVSGRAGQIEFEGQYRYQANASRPHQFRVSIEELDAAELERVLAPTLDRRQGLLARALRLGRAPLPGWLAARHAGGLFEIGSLTFEGALLASNVRGRLLWDGPGVEVVNLEAHSEGASLAGRLSVNLRRATPQYRLSGNVRSLNWSGGSWDGDAVVETAGIGASLLANLRSEGSFSGHAVEFAPDAGFESVSGRFVLTFGRAGPRLRITGLQAVAGREIFQGECRIQDGGRLLIEFTNGRKQVRLAGTLSPFEIEPAAAR